MKRIKDTVAAYFFLLPNGLGLLTFTLLPILGCLALSFLQWDGVSSLRDAKFVGWDNFRMSVGLEWKEGRLVANDPDFWRYLLNTIFLMGTIPVGIALSLGAALLLNQGLRGTTILRAIFFLPTMCPIVAVCVIWRWILNDQYGPLNASLMHLGIQHAPGWLGDPAWAKPAIMMMLLWIGIGGYNCVLYLAGLQNIPQELYEAAALDGADWWARLRHITWPMLTPTTFFIFTIGLIAGFQGGFTPAYLMTGGGPGGATTTLSYYIYNNAFVFSETLGKAAAMAWVLFLLVLAATIVNWRYHQRVVHYA